MLQAEQYIRFHVQCENQALIKRQGNYHTRSIINIAYHNYSRSSSTVIETNNNTYCAGTCYNITPNKG